MYKPKPVDTTDKDIAEYLKIVLRGRNDPIWFAEELLGVNLFPVQKEIMSSFYNDNYKRMVIVAGMRSGKCIKNDSSIWMADGTVKRLMDVKVGDMVLSLDNDKTTHSKVLDVIDSGMKDAYEITLHNGHKIYASDEHKFLTKMSLGRKIKRKKWMKVKDLYVGDHIAMASELNHNGVDEYPLNYYELLGYLLGDGGITKNVRFTAESSVVAEHVESLLPDGIIMNKERAKYGYSITSIKKGGTKNSITEWLKEIGLHGCNSHTKTIPEFVFKSSKEAIAKTLSGLIVTDGHVSKQGIEFYSVSYELAKGVEHCLRILGIVPSLKIKRGKYKGELHTSYRVSFSRQEHLIIADEMFNLLHKHDRLTETLEQRRNGKNMQRNCYVEDTQYNKINSITHIGKLPMMDLEIEGTHNYVANGICSHNSALASIMTAYEYFLLCTIDDPAAYYGLMPNQLISISCIAASESQAKDTIFSNTRNMIENSEFFQTWTDTKPKEMELTSRSKNIQIRTISSSATTAVGRSNKAVIFDELANFEESTSKKGAWSIYERLIKSTDTFGNDGHIMSISSPRHPTDIMMTLYKRGLEEDNTLALMKPTWEMNPHMTKEALMAEHKYNMQAFYRDYACQPGAYSAVQFPEGVKMDEKIVNVLENTITNNMVPHVLSIDPAVKNDAFGMATGYIDVNGKIVVDGCSRFEREHGMMMINPIEIRNFIDVKIKELAIHTVVFDVWLFPELLHHLEDELGLNVIKHIVYKEDYDRWRELQTDKLLSLVDDDFLRLEAESLVIKNEKKVDHTSSSTKDVSDCVCNCIWHLTENSDAGRTPAIFTMVGH